MNDFLKFGFFLFMLMSFKVGAEEIKSKNVLFTKTYSIGEKETGFWGPTKEYHQVVEALKSDEDAARYYQKSQYFNYAEWAAVIGYIANDNPDEGESFDEKNFMIFFPVVLALAFGQSHFMGKAVDAYNANLQTNVHVDSDKTFFTVSYRF